MTPYSTVAAPKRKAGTSSGQADDYGDGDDGDNDDGDELDDDDVTADAMIKVKQMSRRSFSLECRENH